MADYGNTPGDGPLRYGGMAGSIPQDEENLPSKLSKAAQCQREALELVRDLVAGNERVRAKGSTYLPREPGEDDRNYNVRLFRSVFFNVIGHTIKGLVGQIFRKDPVLGTDVPPLIQSHWENIDLAGTHGDVFARDIEADAMTAGHAAILVEFPQTDGTQPRSAELGPDAPIRPYWVPIQKDNILSWRTTIEFGRLILSQLVLKECQCVPDGAFGERERIQYRVFYRIPPTDATGPIVGVKVLEITDDNRVIVVSEGLYPTQIEIPVSEIPTSGRKGLFESDPPLLDLAYLNVAYYQQWSDMATSIHKTCVPIYVETGVDPEPLDELGNAKGPPIILGPNMARRFNNPDAKAFYVSHDGAALGSCKTALDDLKSDMSVLGLAMLSPQKRAAETATAKRLDKVSEDSALAVTARGLQDGLERALGFHARYLGLEGGSVEINREFDTQTMAADLLTAYVGAVANAGLPPRILLEAMQTGGLIQDDENIEELEAEMEAAAQAIEDQKKQEAADQLAMQQEALKMKQGMSSQSPMADKAA